MQAAKFAMTGIVIGVSVYLGLEAAHLWFWCAVVLVIILLLKRRHHPDYSSRKRKATARPKGMIDWNTGMDCGVPAEPLDPLPGAPGHATTDIVPMSPSEARSYVAEHEETVAAARAEWNRLRGIPEDWEPIRIYKSPTNSLPEGDEQVPLQSKNH